LKQRSNDLEEQIKELREKGMQLFAWPQAFCCQSFTLHCFALSIIEYLAHDFLKFSLFDGHRACKALSFNFCFMSEWIWAKDGSNGIDSASCFCKTKGFCNDMWWACSVRLLSCEPQGTSFPSWFSYCRCQANSKLITLSYCCDCGSDCQYYHSYFSYIYSNLPYSTLNLMLFGTCLLTHKRFLS
jgi:hypothetical protein